MMTAHNLAFVVITLTAPADMEGVSFGPEHPTECAATMDRLLDDVWAAGGDGFGRCFYTAAPSISLRPIARPW